jgi:hypothetical protein
MMKRYKWDDKRGNPHYSISKPPTPRIIEGLMRVAGLVLAVCVTIGVALFILRGVTG